MWPAKVIYSVHHLGTLRAVRTWGQVVKFYLHNLSSTANPWKSKKGRHQSAANAILEVSDSFWRKIDNIPISASSQCNYTLVCQIYHCSHFPQKQHCCSKYGRAGDDFFYQRPSEFFIHLFRVILNYWTHVRQLYATLSVTWECSVWCEFDGWSLWPLSWPLIFNILFLTLINERGVRVSNGNQWENTVSWSVFDAHHVFFPPQWLFVHLCPISCPNLCI